MSDIRCLNAMQAAAINLQDLAQGGIEESNDNVEDLMAQLQALNTQ